MKSLRKTYDSPMQNSENENMIISKEENIEKENLQNEEIINKTLNDPSTKRYINILTNDKMTYTGEDKYGNNRGFCLICKEKCTSYTQSGIDNLCCGNCGCGASAHKLIPVEEFDIESFMFNLNNDFIPKLNSNIKESDLNFNSFVVVFKILDVNSNISQFSWLFQLFREADINVLNMEVKKIKDNVSVINNKIFLNRYDLDKDVSETQFLKIKDSTFGSLQRIEDKLKLMTYNEKEDENKISNVENFYETVQKLRGVSLIKKFIEVNMKNVIHADLLVGKKIYDEFKNPVLILCLSTNLASKDTDEDISINFFEKFWFALMNSDKFLNKLASSTLKLLYYSKNKIHALWDVQVLFPQQFKADQMFQLLISKKRHEQNFNKSLSLYKDGLSSNSFRISQIMNFHKLSDLKRLTENNINSRQSANRNIGNYVMDLYENYLCNSQLQNQPCSIMQVSNIGVQKEASDMSFSLAFNSDFIITRYDDEKECEEINNFFFSLTDVNSTSSYERILVIFRPFVIRSGLNEIFTNIFKINNFTILTRKIAKLNKNQISYLYNHEFPTQVKLPFNLYYNMMSDSNCELLIMSKFSAFVDAATIIGLNRDNEINVNQYNTVTNNLAYVSLYTPYLINPNRIDISNPKVKKEYYVKFNPKMNSSNSNLRSAQCFKDITSLIDIGQFLNDMMQEKMKFNNYNTYSMMHRLKTNLLKFASFFNLFIYSNTDKFISDEEINYFCPIYGDIQEVFILTKNLSLIQDIILALKFEIVDAVQYRLSEEEFERLFSIYLFDNHGNIFIHKRDYDINKEFLLNNDITIVRLIKPGGYYELEKIIGNENFLFIKIDSEIERMAKDEKVNNTNVLIKTLKYNSYLLDNSINIEYFYPIVDDRIDKIEGSYILLNNPEDQISIPDILQSCLKCTVGENLRLENKQTIHNQNLIERYLRFFHFNFNETESQYFIECLQQYMFNYNDKDNNILLNKFYEIIKYNNLSFPNNLSYFVESSNLGFYEIRIPILEYFTQGGWTYINNMDYLLNKNFLYTDNNFYEQFIEKNQNKDKMVIFFFPFSEPNRNNLQKFLDLKSISETISSRNNTLRYNSVEFKLNDLDALAEGNLSLNLEDNLNIQKRIFYLTKYEGTKTFYKNCITNNPNIKNIPHNYHYRIKPEDIFMDINRIYEVEEFGGLFFIEMVIQDFMKYRPSELNENRENGRIIPYSTTDIYGGYDDHIQFSLTGFLWGKKLMKICQVIENFETNPNNPFKIDNYGPVLYYPKKQRLMGMINEKNIKEYEHYLYVNILDDIRYSKLVNEDDVIFLEKKLFEVFNSEIYNSTRENVNNIRFVPTRVTENNLRINKTNKSNVIKDEESTFNNTVDPQNEMKFHYIFKENERNHEIQSEILSKNIYLIDLFCCNGMKYHMYAALLFLLEVYFKKINRKVNLITMEVDESNVKKSKEKEYDNLLEAIFTGFKSQSYINYSANNDKNRYNAYDIEYFFYCLKEMKFILNENKYLNKQLNEINKSLEKPDLDYNIRNELNSIKSKIEGNIYKNTNDFHTIIEESKNCPLRQSEEDLDNYKYYWAPRSRYYIPLDLHEKWERDLSNEKYIITQKVNYNFLKNLRRLKDQGERQTFSSTGYNLANDYFLISKSMLREPEPELSDKILLHKKKDDKTGKKQKIFENIVKKVIKEDQKKDTNTMFGILSQGISKIESQKRNSIDIFNTYEVDEEEEKRKSKKQTKIPITAGGNYYNNYYSKMGTLPLLNSQNFSGISQTINSQNEKIENSQPQFNETNNNLYIQNNNDSQINNNSNNMNNQTINSQYNNNSNQMLKTNNTFWNQSNYSQNLFQSNSNFAQSGNQFSNQFNNENNLKSNTFNNSKLKSISQNKLKNPQKYRNQNNREKTLDDYLDIYKK